jgi:8-oxo-dGTP pyrophosphatase MutT (NUDIX family)
MGLHFRTTFSTPRTDSRLDAVIRALGDALARRPPPPEREWPAAVGRAAVALLLREAAGAPGATELLLIRRATREGDPWSGHVALPGGRADPADRDTVHTAARETHEEVGIDLARAGRWVGALPPVHPRPGAPPIVVQPHVFAVRRDTEPLPNHEVAEAAWIPARELMEPDAVAEYRHALAGGGSLPFPALSVRGYLVWGLTHRILLDFLAAYDEAVGGPEA